MTGSSKILTVSYGTFSCTLEGFENSVAVMRTVAEYFRDLAADDQLFGTEPQIPDLETLEKLAEEQSQQRVQADLTDGRITLRAPGAPEDSASGEAEASDTTGAETVGTVGVNEDHDPETKDNRPAGLRATLARIRNAMTRPRTSETEVEPNATAPDSYRSDDTPNSAPVEGDTVTSRVAIDSIDDGPTGLEAVPSAGIVAPSESEASRTTTDAAQATLTESLRRAVADTEEAQASTAMDDTDDEILAAAEETTDTSDIAAPPHQPGGVEDIWNTMLESVRNSSRNAPEGDTSAPDEDEFSDPDAEQDADASIARVLDGIVADDRPPQITPASDTASSAALKDKDHANPEEHAATGAGSPGTDLATREAPAHSEQRGASALTDADADESHLARLLDEANSKLAGDDSRRRRSAIEHLKAAFKVTRTEEEDADMPFGQTADPSYGDESGNEETNIAHKGPCTRTNSGAATGRTGENGAEAIPSTPARIIRPGRPRASGTHARPSESSLSEQAIQPLLLGTNQRVAAAERSTTDERVAGNIPVRPRRISPQKKQMEAASTRGTVSSLTTLESTGTRRPPEVEPRITLVEDNAICADVDDFPSYAASHAADGIEDLLECAAAYVAETTANPGFAHPQLMDMIRDLPEQSGLRREDSLRAFGILLRRGTFQKRERGLFVLSESSRYVASEQDQAI